jgi:hypothetical protein
MVTKISKIVRCNLFPAMLVCCSIQMSLGQSSQTIYQSKSYSIYGNRVEQGEFKAEALSDSTLVSNYQSPESEIYSPTICFKFSINLRDNEMRSGKNHWVTLQPRHGECVTTVEFGKQFIDTFSLARGENLAPNTKWIIRLDMREMLKAFKEKGFYTLYNGDKLYQADFKGVYIAGGTRPLSWDFNNLEKQSEYQLKDSDGDSIYQTTLIMNAKGDEKKTKNQWSLTKDVSSFPQYKSDYPISDALYDLALEEMTKAIEPDSTFRTGKEWAGVWTRDISYSIILSMAYLQPKVAQYSLLRKVKDGRIIQDTGTGGAYPVSTDRMIWADAAWELYKTTGDTAWLKQAYIIIRNSVNDDMKNAYDHATGLVHGESTFLDWREQTYPKWMQPADIYMSEDLGTNAVHYRANVVLARMAGLLHDPKAAAFYSLQAGKIKAGINKCLWMSDKGYYGQYLYGRNYKILSPRSEALGEALSVLFNVADSQQKKSIIENAPVTNFGISCIYPQIPDISPYHNNAVWPFVQSYWALASAEAGNEKSVLESMAAVYRPAAMFLTNKENFVASDGDFAGTQINSSNMLWSLSGSLSLIYKVIFGIEFQKDRLIFHPFVPKTLAGKCSLTNFKCRKAVLNIEMQGYGNVIKSFELDGKAAEHSIPYTLSGVHVIKIVLENNELADSKINKVVNYTSLDFPIVSLSDGVLSWPAVKGAVSYIVLKNGQPIVQTTKISCKVKDHNYAEYQVIAVDAKEIGSFASEPVVDNGGDFSQVFEIENYASKSTDDYKNYSGTGYVEISKTKNRSISIPVNIKHTGIYAISFRYANGNGPINTENKCAIRTLKIDGIQAGAVILPQRGTNEWSNWGYSNGVHLSLSQGRHLITLSFEPYNENMNGAINQAMLDEMIIKRLE